jgi:transcription elongation factor GreB
MSRWKPPSPKSSPYITPEGFTKLQEEYQSIWKRRAEVTNALAAAAAEGDRSENAEYIYRKKELSGLDSRIRYLQLRMQELNVVNQVNDNKQVYFGAWVTLVDMDGTENKIRIVGSDELGDAVENISVDSPLARALLGRSCFDEVNFKISDNLVKYEIISIDY